MSLDNVALIIGIIVGGGAILAFVWKTYRFLSKITLVAGEVFSHFTPDSQGQSMPGNISRIAESNDEIGRDVKHAIGRIDHLEGWVDGVDPDWRSRSRRAGDPQPE